MEKHSMPNQVPDDDDDDQSSLSLGPPPPVYEPLQQHFNLGPSEFSTAGSVSHDGRVDFDVSSSFARVGGLTKKVLASSLQKQLESYVAAGPSEFPPEGPEWESAVPPPRFPPPGLSIVIHIVGSRGDVQPFIALGLELQLKHGHRVRIATHPVFQRLVEGYGLEFFSIGGDPAELMAYMVKNPGLLPRLDTLRGGEVQRRRLAMALVMRGCWRSCFETGNGLAEHPGGGSSSSKRGVRRPAPRGDAAPFVADAIIANPPSFAHLHCAEKLGIPLHLMFTMPWTPTQSFAHPLANIRTSTSDLKVANFLSYIVVDMMTWQGLGDVINKFRVKTLGLERIDPTWAPGMVMRLRIPFTYCWSPTLIPKPKDWASNISVAGFFFVPTALDFIPPADLVSFLNAGPPPIYIGFGSIVVDDPNALTSLVLEAIRLAGVRAIVSKGWGNIGATSLPENVFILGDCPHDWLFNHVSCVVHHGGAGTTSTGLSAGKPTVVVPFFGDQYFWGEMVYRAGAGPEALPYKTLTPSTLAKGIVTALQPDLLRAAQTLGDSVRQENGPAVGVESFHNHLPVAKMGCALAPGRVAVWQVRGRDVRLSALAATVLRRERRLDDCDLVLYRPCEYETNSGPWEPVSGATIAVLDLFYGTAKGLAEFGSEFTRVPYVGQKQAHAPAASSSNLDSSDWQKYPGAKAVKGIGRIVIAGARAPGNFTLAMAKGSHNLPRVWGDTTVRPQEKVTGVTSGLVAGVKTFAWGTVDGITGLGIQPITGLIHEGPLGFVKGVGKAAVGLPCKWWGGMNALVGYPLKGIDVAVTKAFKGDTARVIRSERIAQGEIHYANANEREKQNVLQAWHRWVEQEEAWHSEHKRKGKERAVPAT